MTTDNRSAANRRSPFDSPVKWQQLAIVLRTQIENGDLIPGEPAPSITALVRDGHANSRQTCGKALRSLADEGLLIRYPGLGYYVADRPE